LTDPENLAAMDSYELNKVLGALLFTSLVVLSLNITAGAVFSPHKPEKPGYEIAVPEPTAPGTPDTPAVPDQPIEQLLAKADVKRGETSAKKCGSCHNFGKGEPNKQGPLLYGVVGRPRGSVPGFNYSAAMKGRGGEWNFAELNQFITNPKGFVPGTTMSFAGIPRATERADILVYLNSHSDSPAPLPQAAEAAPAAPAGGAPAGQAPAAAAPAGQAPAAPSDSATPAPAPRAP
jgi:cytochrome c